MSSPGLVTAIAAILGCAVVYGCDVFAAVVLRPAAAKAGEAAVADLVGWIHEYGDARLPAPFVVAVASSALTAVLTTSTLARTCALIALLALLVWLGLFVRVSAPVNERLRAAARTGTVPADVRTLQRRWDSVTWARAGLQTIAMSALLVAVAWQ